MISNAMIQKWIKMLRHDSVLHVEQSEGKHYSASEMATIIILAGKLRAQRTLTQLVSRRILHHTEMKKKRCIFLLPSFNMVWVHMTCGLKLKSGTTTILF